MHLPKFQKPCFCAIDLPLLVNIEGEVAKVENGAIEECCVLERQHYKFEKTRCGMEVAQLKFGPLGFLLGNNQPRHFTLFFVEQKHGKLDHPIYN